MFPGETATSLVVRLLNAVRNGGKKIVGTAFGNLVAYEIQFSRRYNLAQTTIINAPSSSTLDRGNELAEAAIIAPLGYHGEEWALALVQMGTLLQILRRAWPPRQKIKATALKSLVLTPHRRLEYTANLREDATALIGKWMALTPIQLAKRTIA